MHLVMIDCEKNNSREENWNENFKITKILRKNKSFVKKSLFFFLICVKMIVKNS